MDKDLCQNIMFMGQSSQLSDFRKVQLSRKVDPTCSEFIEKEYLPFIVRRHLSRCVYVKSREILLHDIKNTHVLDDNPVNPTIHKLV